MLTDSSAPRVAIYGTGQYGQYIARMALAKNWRVVAAYNRSGPKVGQDLGRLAGLEKDIGVIVQDCDQADFSALKADIGIVTMTSRLAPNFPAYERLMNAGLNVLCIGGEGNSPKFADKKMADEIDDIAKRNGVTFSGSGIWDISRVWAALLITGNCTEIRSLFHRSLTNTEAQHKNTIRMCGAGMSLEEFDEKIGKHAGLHGNLFTLFPQHVLSALGYTVTSATERREPVFSDRPYYCKPLECEFPTGSIMGRRNVVEVLTKEGVTVTAHMEVRLLFREGETEHMMWSVDGMPSTSVTIERKDSIHATAAAIINRVKDVIAAPPGIQMCSQLGPMKHSALD